MYCLVTGGAQGIGRAIVKLFLQRGDRVVVLDCLDEATEIVQSLKQDGAEGALSAPMLFLSLLLFQFSRLLYRLINKKRALMFWLIMPV